MYSLVMLSFELELLVVVLILAITDHRLCIQTLAAQEQESNRDCERSWPHQLQDVPLAVLPPVWPQLVRRPLHRAELLLPAL